MTSDSPQSRSLLKGEETYFAPAATTRDLLGTLRNFHHAARLLRERDVSRVVSTGAAIATAFLPLARLVGAEAHYIESATRVDSPSLTGRIVQRVPGVRVYSQYQNWADPSWSFRGSVFDPFRSVACAPPSTIKRVVVSIGTHPRYGFDRLLRRLIDILPATTDVLWQVGPTQMRDQLTNAQSHIDDSTLRRAMTEADVVITHAGVGSALSAMLAGHRPICVPRLARYGEHVDDHQSALAARLSARQLVISREAGHLTEADLMLAAQSRVISEPAPAPFALETY